MLRSPGAEFRESWNYFKNEIPDMVFSFVQFVFETVQHSVRTRQHKSFALTTNLQEDAYSRHDGEQKE